MITLHQEYDTYKTDFKNKQKNEVIKELHLVELELEDLIENRSACEKGSAQSFINLSFTIIAVITAAFWKIFDIVKENFIIGVILLYLVVILGYILIELNADRKKIELIKQAFSDERNKIIKLKMKIKILNELLK